MKETAIAGCLVLLIALGMYVGGYIACNKPACGSDRHFPSYSVCQLYRPAIKVESWLRGRNIRFSWESEWDEVHIETGFLAQP